MFSKKGGYSLYEMVLVMGILTVFAVCSYTLLSVGTESFSSIQEKREQGSNTRLAMSYITMRVRQNDAAGQVSVRQILGSGALVITETYDDTDYETIVFFKDGALYEVFQEASIALEPAAGELITRVEAVYISETEDGNINIQVIDGQESLETSLTLRAAY